MAQVRCPYCHEFVDKAAYPAHEAEHVKIRPDGQQTDYTTLPEEEREQGDLAGVPRVYVHLKCGAATGMPEEIIRTYLRNPFHYSDHTYCCGCGRHVPLRECVWTETGENLLAYMDKLRASKPTPAGCIVAAAVVCVLALIGAAMAIIMVVRMG